MLYYHFSYYIVVFPINPDANQRGVVFCPGSLWKVLRRDYQQ